METIEYINLILSYKNKPIFKEIIEDTIVKFREENFKYKLLNKTLKEGSLVPEVVKLAEIEELYEIFVESLIGMNYLEINKYLNNLKENQKNKYLMENIDNMSFHSQFERKLMSDFVNKYQTGKKSIKDLFTNKEAKENAFVKCCQKSYKEEK